MNLKIIMLSEKHQTKRVCTAVPFIGNSRKHLLLENGAWGGAGGRALKGPRKLTGRMDVFTSLMVGIILCV